MLGAAHRLQHRRIPRQLCSAWLFVSRVLKLEFLFSSQAITLASVVWSALRTGSNTDAFLGGSGSSPAEQPLLSRRGDEEDGSAAEEGTSAGLDGEAPRQQPAMSACEILHCKYRKTMRLCTHWAPGLVSGGGRRRCRVAASAQLSCGISCRRRQGSGVVGLSRPWLRL